MSVIGPRPVVEEELAAYGDDAGELLSAKPGITGWWQVQARNDATYGDGSRQELELWRRSACWRTPPPSSPTRCWPTGGSVGAVGAWAGIVAYTFQIFFDFSGYSDMAIGLGMMFGFRYLRNFNYPYIAKSATEFWRRWHISLGSFFRDYVYIPLGGNRRGKSRWLINLMIVWGLTGVWHGAAWNFVLWGLFYGALLIVEKLWLLRRMERLPAVLQHLYGIAVFMFGWLIFWIEDPAAFGEYLLALGGAFGATGTSTVWELNVWAYWPVLLICAVASTPVLPWLRAKVVAWASGRSARGFLEDDLPGEKRLSVDGLCDTRAWFDALPSDARRSGRLAVQALAIAADVGALALLALSILSVVAGTFNPFIYFRF